jgi:hypothetical protein
LSCVVICGEELVEVKVVFGKEIHVCRGCLVGNFEGEWWLVLSNDVLDGVQHVVIWDDGWLLHVVRWR